MKISFHDNDEKTESKILVNNKPVGIVKLNVWEQKWTMHPNFKWTGKQDMLYKKYDSGYKAGKAMVRLYEKMLESWPPTYDEHNVDPLKDTDEFDMRDALKLYTP
tara:strand:+ start:112 stop:426 length:315 start_codon:yes stop_codon:yes gene_type:complete